MTVITDAGDVEALAAINVVFDGPPAHESGRFVEVETDEGKSVRVGQWIERPDGLWALRIDLAATDLRAIIPADVGLDAVKAQAAREALLAAADDYERERIERHEIVIAALDSKYDNGVVSGPAKFLRARADQIGGAK